MKSVEQRAILDKYVGSSAEEKAFLERKYDFLLFEKNTCQQIHLDMARNSWKIWQMILQVRTMSKIKHSTVPIAMLLLRRMMDVTRYEMKDNSRAIFSTETSIVRLLAGDAALTFVGCVGLNLMHKIRILISMLLEVCLSSYSLNVTNFCFQETALVPYFKELILALMMNLVMTLVMRMAGSLCSFDELPDYTCSCYQINRV